MPWVYDMGHAKHAARRLSKIDMALDYGVNFIDTAEMYPTTPLGKDTQGDTERIIGDWIAQSGRQ